MKLRIFFIAIVCFFLSFTIKSKKLSLDKWQYILVDSTRTRNDIRKDCSWFGMDFADGNKDSYADIAVGKWFFLNPGNPKDKWTQSVVKDSTDIMFIIDVDGDEFTDLIGLHCNQQIWFEATDKKHTKWKETVIGNQNICNHTISSMGYCKADVYKGGKKELLFTDNPGKIWCFEIPKKPNSIWPVTIITESGATEKFVSSGDIDGDGDLDLATGYKLEGKKKYTGVCWFENSGSRNTKWTKHLVGQVDNTADHFAVADFDKDGIAEIIVTESLFPEKYPAGIYMFKSNKKDITEGKWEKKLIKTQFSTNSLEVADMDQDGDMDFVTAEHKGSCKLQIWENNGAASFTEHVIDSLKESHNGAKLLDIDSDGDIDISTSGWYEFKNLHLWINKAID